MTTESTEALPTGETEKKAPKKKTAKKPTVDLSDLQSGMESSHLAKVGIEQDSKIEIPKTATLTPGFAPLSALEESLRRKQLGTRKPKAVTKPTIEKPVADENPHDSNENKRNSKEKVQELNNLIGFVESEFARLDGKRKKALADGRADKAYELDNPIETLLYEIRMLNGARQAFLNPRNSMTEDEWDDASKARDNVMGRMEESKREEKSKQQENSPEGMEKRVKKLNELIPFVVKHKNSLVTKMLSSGNDKDEVKRLRVLIDEASNKIKLLEKARNAFSSTNPKDALSSAELKEVEKVQSEVITRMKEVSNGGVPKQEEISPEDMEKRVKKLDVLLPFIRNHKNSLVTKMNLPETDKKEVERLKSVISDMKYRMDVLENARRAFLSKDPKDALTDDQMAEVENVRDEVIERMASVATKSEEVPVAVEETKVRIPVTPKAPEAKKKVMAPKVPKTPEVKEEIVAPEIPAVPETPVVEKKVASVEETPEISKETPEKEETLRQEIQKIYGEGIASLNEKIETSRKAYLRELKLKTQHDQTQSKIGRLMYELLGRAVGKKTSAQEANYLATEKAYKEDISLLKLILNDYPIKDELIKNSFEMGDRGLQILEEERLKVLTETVRQVLISEKKAILDAIESVVAAKDINNVNKLVDLYQKKGMSLLGRTKNLLGINQEENA